MVKVDGFDGIETLDPKTDEVTLRYDASKTDPQKLAAAISSGTRFKASLKEGSGGAADS